MQRPQSAQNLSFTYLMSQKLQLVLTIMNLMILAIKTTMIRLARRIQYLPKLSVNLFSNLYIPKQGILGKKYQLFCRKQGILKWVEILKSSPQSSLVLKFLSSKSWAC